jgi:hypothetical protein
MVVDGHGSPSFTVPRIEAEVTIDGYLDEEPWQQAARLTGFSQYRPVDGRPAEERTEVLVWYSPTALHFGIIAYDRDPSSIRATVADRDNLGRDDSVTIYLDTFDDRRRAFLFGVNPLGVQEDGVHSEGAFNPGTMWGGNIDRNPDYHFESKGRITDEGYIVEVRIPFKSLRYPSGEPQRWGLNLLRKVQRTGYEDTWTDVRRASSSFLAQAGVMEGLHDMKRGVVTEVQPFATTASNGALNSGTGLFGRDPVDFSPGVNLRLGFPNLSLDATVNPDFSQVESDAGLVTVNQRFALFYSEKRPFFLEGIELFATPNQLVYTRRIVDPVAGGKITGKVGNLAVAYLAARDRFDSSMVNIGRLRQDLGSDSIAGVTYTDRTSGDGYNRVLATDARVVFKRLYYVQAQAGQAWTENGAEQSAAPIWLAELDRTGRAWGFNYKITGIGQGFQARSGFVPRNDIVEARASNRLTLYGERGDFLESVTAFFGPSRIWRYADFGAKASIEGDENVNLLFQLRGGWMVHSRTVRNHVRFDHDTYRTYEVERPDGRIEPYQAADGLSNAFAQGVSVGTPVFRRFNARVEWRRGATAIFPEASEGREMAATTSISLRPTGSIRLEATNTYSHIVRKRDGSEFARTLIPRLKAEYQPRRSLFFRIVGEYRDERQSELRAALAGHPLRIGGIPSTGRRFDGLRLDWLLSFEPSPGRVVFFGYGSAMENERPFNSRYSDLRRSRDGIFLKVAYQFRR